MNKPSDQVLQSLPIGHSEDILNESFVPFAIASKDIEWDKVEKLISFNNKDGTIAVKMNNNEILLVLIKE